MDWNMSDPSAVHQVHGHDFGLGVEDEVQLSPVDSVAVRGSPQSVQYNIRVVWSISRSIGSGRSSNTTSMSQRCAADSPAGTSIPVRKILPRLAALEPF